MLLSSSLHFQTMFAVLNSTVLKNNYREAVMRSTYLFLIQKVLIQVRHKRIRNSEASKHWAWLPMPRMQTVSEAGRNHDQLWFCLHCSLTSSAGEQSQLFTLTPFMRITPFCMLLWGQGINTQPVKKQNANPYQATNTLFCKQQCHEKVLWKSKW